MKIELANRWFILGPVGCVAVPLICIPAIQWLAVSKNGSDLVLGFEMPLLLMATAAFFGFFGAILGLAFKKTRRAAALFGLCSVIYLPVFVWSLRIGDRVRMNAFYHLAERSRPLIDAIRAFEQKTGRPPESLSSLVPDFIPSVPGTGMGAYPEYRYLVNTTNWDGNPWVLTVFTPSGGINFDQFIYFPLTNYPPRGYGGWLERVGDWAYVHE